VAPNQRLCQVELCPDDARAVALELRPGCTMLAEPLALADEATDLGLEALDVTLVLPQADSHTERYRHHGHAG
jgi:hypothetical protein